MKDGAKTKESGSLRKEDIVREVARQTGLGKEETGLVLESFMSAVQRALLSGRQVSLRGFGTFANRVRAKRVARNLKRNTSMVLPERHVPTFKPSKKWVIKTREDL